jgi:hypothetical protein
MIEHLSLARAHAPPPAPAHWTRPTLPRGPSPLSKLAKRLRARLTRAQARAQARRAQECGC